MIRGFIGAVLMALAAPASAGWLMAETEHFRVYSRGPEAGLTRQAALLEDYRKLLVMATTAPPGAENAPRLDVFVLGDVAESKPYGRLSADTAGYYTADSGRIAAFADTGSIGQAVLLHEYAHHFMLAGGAVAYPAWYVEGFAEYFMTATFRPERIDFGTANPGRASWLLNAPWLPVERLVSATPKLRNASDRAIFYAQSWLLAHYFFRAPGMKEKLTAYLRAVAGGADSVMAFKTHVDPDLNGLQGRLKRYLTSRSTTFSRFQRPAATAAAVKVTRLPASADKMLMLLTATEMGLDKDEGPRALADIRRLAATMPGDALAQRTLALAEVRHGDRPAGIATIDRLLAATPDDPTLLRWRASALAPYATPAAVREARQLLARSFKADGSDWRTLFAYAALFDPLRKPLEPNVLDVLLRAHELAPQVGEIAMTTAIALVRADRLPQAVPMLESIAYSPHDEGLAERAAAMLVAARAGDKPGVLSALERRVPDDAAAVAGSKPR